VVADRINKTNDAGRYLPMYRQADRIEKTREFKAPETARQKKGAVSVPTLAAPVPWAAAAAWPFCLSLTRTRTGAAASGPVAGLAGRAVPRQGRVVQPQIRRHFARIRWLHGRCCSFLLGLVTGGRAAALIVITTGPVIEPVRSSVRWFNGPTVTNRLNHRFNNSEPLKRTVSYGPPWAHYLGGYQDRLLGGPLGLPDLRCTVPDGVKHKGYRGEVLG
jgi:hypothetical protein